MRVLTRIPVTELAVGDAFTFDGSTRVQVATIVIPTGRGASIDSTTYDSDYLDSCTPDVMVTVGYTNRWCKRQRAKAKRRLRLEADEVWETCYWPECGCRRCKWAAKRAKWNRLRGWNW